jgi:hypothetical protein
LVACYGTGCSSPNRVTTVRRKEQYRSSGLMRLYDSHKACVITCSRRACGTCSTLVSSESVDASAPSPFFHGIPLADAGISCLAERFRQDAHLLLALWILGGFTDTDPCSVNKNRHRANQSTVVTKASFLCCSVHLSFPLST